MLIWIGIEIFLKKGKSYFLIVNHLSNFQQFKAKLKEKIIKLKHKNIKKYKTKKKGNFNIILFT